VFDSHIGYGSPHKQDTAEAHGEPLGDDGSSTHKKELRLALGPQISRSGRGLRNISQEALARVVTNLGRIGLRFLPPIERSISSLPKT
jgi:hypothetical protein